MYNEMKRGKIYSKTGIWEALLIEPIKNSLNIHFRGNDTWKGPGK